MTAPPTIETARLTLRAWRESDFPAMARFYADDQTARFVGGVMTPDEAWRRMATYVGHWSLRGYGPWALEEKSSGAFIGYSGLWNPHGWPEREINWGLLPEKQGNGFIVEAAQRVREFAYGELRWNTVVSCIALENTKSRRVAERLGCRLDRTTENSGFLVGVFRHPSPAELTLK